MSSKYINLACGPVYIDSTDWINFDFSPATSGVRKANLLERLPLLAEGSELVYSSHFLEHIPKGNVSFFLRECYRVLQPNGLLRLVLPDFEEMARTYLSLRESSNHERADFLILEIIDQCVRSNSGGELGRFYTQLQNETTEQTNLVEFVHMRTGEDLRMNKNIITNKPKLSKIVSRILNTSCITKRIQHLLWRIWLKVWIAGLPAAFRAQNISLAGIGERHQWLWDFHQLSQALESVGFVKIQRRSADSSSLADFPFYPLDIDTNGRPRKGMESMYIEAKKPN
jgi:predicted SAM-dependent methyltransferase